MAKLIFSPVQDRTLIELVRENRVLYDTNNRDYKSQEVRDEIWEKIATRVGRSCSDCKKRWRNIRDTFYKHKRHNKRQLSAGRRLKKSKWILTEYLSFLNDFPCSSSIANSMSENPLDSKDWSQVIEEDTFLTDFPNSDSKHNSLDRDNDPLEFRVNAADGLPGFERDRSSERQQRELENSLHKKKCSSPDDEYDPVLTFFRSMALTVRNFEPELIAEAKSKVFAVVMELEQKSLED